MWHKGLHILPSPRVFPEKSITLSLSPTEALIINALGSESDRACLSSFIRLLLPKRWAVIPKIPGVITKIPRIYITNAWDFFEKAWGLCCNEWGKFERRLPWLRPPLHVGKLDVDK